jgi:hypothetical protein
MPSFKGAEYSGPLAARKDFGPHGIRVFLTEPLTIPLTLLPRTRVGAALATLSPTLPHAPRGALRPASLCDPLPLPMCLDLADEPLD